MRWVHSHQKFTGVNFKARAKFWYLQNEMILNKINNGLEIYGIDLWGKKFPATPQQTDSNSQSVL